MKLKDSYILLIAFIVLLVSIGSVCASEDVTDNDDVILTSNQADVVLTDDGDGTTQEKINTTVDIDDEISFNEKDERQQVPISIKDNESKDIEFTQSDITITEGNDEIIDFMIENNNITFMSRFAVGNHSLLITYKGNDNYASSLKNVTILVTHDKTLDMPSEVVSEKGENVVIPITVNDGIKNYTVNNTRDLKVTIAYIDSEGKIQTINVTDFSVNKNNITVPLTSISIRDVNVTVSYNESSNKTAKIKLLSLVDATGGKVNTTSDKIFTLVIKDGNGNTIVVNKNNLNIKEGDTNLEFTYTNNIVNITSDVSVGKHNLTIIYSGNTTYAGSNGSYILGVFGNSTFSVEKSTNVDSDKNINLQLNLTDGVDPVAIINNNLNITINYIDANGDAKSINVTSFTVSGDQIAKFTFAESFRSANLTVSYLTEEGKLFSDTVIVKVDTTINADDEIKKGDNEVINFTANVTTADGVTITINNDNFKIYNGSTALNTTYADGVFTINNKFSAGVYNLTIRFTGNETYSDAIKNITLSILGFNTNVTTVEVNSTKHGEVKLNLTDGEQEHEISLADLNITVFYLDSDNNTVNITLNDLKLDNNTLTFDIDDDNFTSATFLINYKDMALANLTLNRVYNVRLEVINNEAEFQSGNFTYKVIDVDAPDIPLKNKTIKLEYRVMGGTITFQQTMSAQTDNESIVVFKNSEIFVSYFNLVLGLGNNSVTISGDNLHVENGVQNVTITQATINITIDKYNEYYGSDEKVKIHVFNAKNGDPMKFITLHLYMPSSSAKDYYFQTNENGTSEISVNGLVGGTYNITVNNNDTENMTSKKVSGTIIIKKIPVTINANSVTMYYNSGKTATIKVTKNGKAVSGVYVLVRLYTTSSKYNDYLFQTNSKGQISFSAPLSVGKHKMIVVLADNRYEAKQVTKTITVKKASAKITAPKVTAYYKQGKYFTVKLTNTKNKKVIYGAKLNVKIYVSKTRYYNFNGQTGADGKIRLTINLKPGSYKVEITGKDSKNFKASKASSKITVKKAPTKLTIKKSVKKYIQVTAKNKKTKKVISGIKLKIKVKSKTYTIKTNSKGIAKVSKALKVGKYKVTATSANQYCVAKSTKATVKVKK